MAGITSEYMSRIETGVTRPSLSLIEKISSILELSEAEIMFGNKLEEVEIKDLAIKILSMNEKSVVL